MTGGPSRRRALLLGCGAFADKTLDDLRSPSEDVQALARLLRDPGRCGYEVTAEVGCTSGRAQREIEGFLAGARVTDGMNLLYLSCHGVQDAQGRLYFAFADTERDFLGSTAVSAEWVRDRINSSRSKATLVLVDCCFSGAFLKGMRVRSAGANVEALVQDLPQGSGVAVLTASGDTEASFEDADSPLPRPSYFTGAVISGISSGAADLNRDGRITVDELYEYVYDQVSRGSSPQRPRRLGVGEGTLVVAEADTGRPPDGPAPAARLRRLAATGVRTSTPRRRRIAITLAAVAGATALAVPPLAKYVPTARDGAKDPSSAAPAPDGTTTSPTPSTGAPPPSPSGSVMESAPVKPSTPKQTKKVTTTSRPPVADAPPAGPTGSIAAPADEARVKNCAYFSGRSKLPSGKTLILAARNLSNGDPRRYVQDVFDWDKPETLGSWSGAQYFSGDPGQRYRVELMSVDLAAVRAAQDDGDAFDGLADQGTLLASRTLEREAGNTGNDCEGP